MWKTSIILDSNNNFSCCDFLWFQLKCGHCTNIVHVWIWCKTIDSLFNSARNCGEFLAWDSDRSATVDPWVGVSQRNSLCTWEGNTWLKAELKVLLPALPDKNWKTNPALLIVKYYITSFIFLRKQIHSRSNDVGDFKNGHNFKTDVISDKSYSWRCLLAMLDMVSLISYHIRISSEFRLQISRPIVPY